MIMPDFVHKTPPGMPGRAYQVWKVPVFVYFCPNGAAAYFINSKSLPRTFPARENTRVYGTLFVLETPGYTVPDFVHRLFFITTRLHVMVVFLFCFVFIFFL